MISSCFNFNNYRYAGTEPVVARGRLEKNDNDLKLRGIKINTKELLDPITPGEILREDFMEPMGLSRNKFARDLVVPPNRISGIVNGKRAITADTACIGCLYPQQLLH